MKITRLVKQALPLLLIAAGCTLYNEVSITPLYVLPTNIERGADVAGMVRRSDYLRAIEMTKSIEARDKNAMNDLASLGSAELAAGRYDDARRHLRAAVELKPFRNVYSQVAWDLSQVEYMDSSGVASLVEAFQRARAGNIEFALAKPSDQVRKVLTLARLDKIFTIK